MTEMAHRSEEHFLQMSIALDSVDDPDRADTGSIRLKIEVDIQQLNLGKQSENKLR